MKKCPNCQATFGDDKRFCQIDGTPLIDIVEAPQVEDPFKTVVMGAQNPAMPADDPMKTSVISADSKEDDLLQIPEVFDPMKTMVVSEPFKFDQPAKSKTEEPVVSAPEPPKFSEPSLSPPNFGDLSSGEPPKVEPPPIENPISNPFSEPPKIDSPFSPSANEPPKFEAPKESFDSPFTAPPVNPIPSPFEVKENPPPPFKEPEPAFKVPPSPFEPTPFNQPNESANQPIQQSNWTPPPPPVQSWQEQGVGANTPFQPPPPGTGGQNQTLPIISLVLGIVSLCCYVSPITGLAALITGYKGMKNANNDPNNYGGKGLAIAGMIMGGIFFLVGVCYYIYVFVIIGLVASGNFK